MRNIVILGVVAALVALVGAAAGPATAKVPGSNGRIAFSRVDRLTGEKLVYTANPDGSRVRPLYASPAEGPHWSPDATRVSVFTRCADGQENCAATIIDVDSGVVRQFKWPDPSLETNCGQWAPSGRRLACGAFGVDDPSRNGIYSIRSSDGRGLTRITSNPGGEDSPGDYSPGGGQLVFSRLVDDVPVGLFVTRLDGTGLHRITPQGFANDGLSSGSWSPGGNKILFANRTSADNRLSIWLVNADGGHLHQVRMTPACGGLFTDPTSISCFQPSWSPDGKKIVFTRISANGTQENVYTANTDGSDLQRVSNTGGDEPDWGTHPLLP